MCCEGNFCVQKFPSRSLQKTLYQRGRLDFERFCSVRAERYALWGPVSPAGSVTLGENNTQLFSDTSRRFAAFDIVLPKHARYQLRYIPKY